MLSRWERIVGELGTDERVERWRELTWLQESATTMRLCKRLSFSLRNPIIARSGLALVRLSVHSARTRAGEKASE